MPDYKEYLDRKAKENAEAQAALDAEIQSERPLEFAPMPGYEFDHQAVAEAYKAGGGPILEILEQHKPKPQITPEQARKARFAANITDALGNLAQMYTSHRGAYTRPYDGKTSTGVTNERLNKLQDEYTARLAMHDREKAAAQQRDYELLRQYAQKKAEMDYQAKIAKYNQEIAEQRRQADIRQKDLERRQGVLDKERAALQASELGVKAHAQQTKTSTDAAIRKEAASIKAYKDAGWTRSGTSRTSSGLNISRGNQSVIYNPVTWKKQAAQLYKHMVDAGIIPPSTRISGGNLSDAERDTEIETYINQYMYDVPDKVWNKIVEGDGSFVILKPEDFAPQQRQPQKKERPY